MSKQSSHKKSQNINTWIAYLKGKLSGGESHAFEKRLLHDDFEAEAYEGLSAYRPEDIETDLDKLSYRLKTKSDTPSRSFAIYWRAAAILVLLTAATFTIFKLGFDNISGEQQTSKTEKSVQQESSENNPSQPIAEDSTSKEEHDQPIAMNYNNEASEQETVRETEKPIPSLERSSEPITPSGIDSSSELNNEQNEDRIAAVKPLQPSDDVEERELVGTPDPYKLDNTGVADLPASDEVTRDTEYKGIDSKIKVKPEFEDKKYAQSRRMKQSNKEVSQLSELESEAAESAGAVAESVSITKAQPIGGFDKFYAYMANNIDTTLLSDNEKSTIVKLSLHISREGTLTDVEVITRMDAFGKNPGKKYENDAIKVVKEWSGWTPAVVNGEPSDSKVEVEVRY